MGLHTKKLDSIIDKLIPKETLPSVLSNRMENEIKKSIEKWEHRQGWQSDYAAALALEDFRGLLKFQQENCCGKVGDGQKTAVHT